MGVYSFLFIHTHFVTLNRICLKNSFLGIFSILLLIGYLLWYLLLIRPSQLVMWFKSFIPSITFYQLYHLLKDGLKYSGIIVDWFFSLLFLNKLIFFSDWPIPSNLWLGHRESGLTLLGSAVFAFLQMFFSFVQRHSLFVNSMINWLLLWSCVMWDLDGAPSDASSSSSALAIALSPVQGPASHVLGGGGKEHWLTLCDTEQYSQVPLRSSELTQSPRLRHPVRTRQASSQDKAGCLHTAAFCRSLDLPSSVDFHLPNFSGPHIESESTVVVMKTQNLFSSRGHILIQVSPMTSQKAIRTFLPCVAASSVPNMGHSLLTGWHGELNGLFSDLHGYRETEKTIHARLPCFPAGDWTQGLTHARQAFCSWCTPPAQSSLETGHNLFYTSWRETSAPAQWSRLQVRGAMLGSSLDQDWI